MINIEFTNPKIPTSNYLKSNCFNEIIQNVTVKQRLVQEII